MHCITPRFAVGASAALCITLAASLPAAAEEIVLAGGARMEGKVVKRTSETVFVDLGFTIIGIPAKEVKEVRPAASAPAPAPGSEEKPREPADAKAASPPAGGKGTPQGGERSAAERRSEIWFSRDLEAGSLKDKAKEGAEGVVQIVCPGKKGSGFIINDAEGYVITNFHVIEGDRDISVVIYQREGQELRRVTLKDVRIVAMNPFLDLALLKLDDDTDATPAPLPQVSLV